MKTEFRIGLGRDGDLNPVSDLTQVNDLGTAGYYIYQDYTLIDTLNNPSLTSYQIVFTDIDPHVYSIRAFTSNHPIQWSDRTPGWQPMPTQGWSLYHPRGYPSPPLLQPSTCE
jgi:hypothetical protein